MNEKNINEGKYLAKDLIQGDESVSKRKDFLDLENKEILEGLKLLLKNPYLSTKQKKYLLTNSWKIHYRKKPPSIEEFLTEKWIGPTARNIFGNVRKTLVEYWKPDSGYRNLILGAAIGTGKSFTSTVSALYVASHLWAMRDPKKFFGLSQATSIAWALISFTMEKAKQLLVQPFYQVLISSEKFKRIKLEDRLEYKQTEEYPDKICWTSAGVMGVFQFYNDFHFTIASNPGQLLGLNMIGATLSEISFFIERGYSPEYIWRIFNDSKDRVYNRFVGKYFSTCILDSSPNDIEHSPIDKYIFEGEAYKDPTNYIVTGTHWDLVPEKYIDSDWKKTGKTFPVFKGNSGKPPLMIDEWDINKYSKEDIYNVPIDLKQKFIDNLSKNIKDYCGWPSGTQGRLISDHKVIDKMFDDRLKNILTHIEAPSTKLPKNLIWNMIRDNFFIKIGKNHYEFYRAPLELRYMHVDQSESGDLTGLSMCHPEITKDGVTIYVLDFTIAINPGKDRINLEAIPCFIEDLKKIGKIRFGKITFDQYQSANTIQKLKLKKYNVEKLSVDREMNPYLVMVSNLNNERIKCGKNIYLKNNLKSLQEVSSEKGKRKIDHMVGKIDKQSHSDFFNWNISTLGMYAKDVSDSACGAIWNCIHNYKGVPRYIWDDIDLIKNNIDNKENKNYINNVEKNKILESLREKYGLVT